MEINSVNKVGYGNLDSSTRDLCNFLSQKIIEMIKKTTHLFVATLGGPVFLLGKVRIAVNEPVIGQGPSTIVTKGIILCVVGLSNAEGMCLRPLVELGRVGERRKCASKDG